jgi:hypothetical protein
VKFSNFQTDLAAEREGVWCEIGEGCSLLIARAGNPQHEETVARLEREMRPQSLAADAELSSKLRTEIAIKALAANILLGWRGLIDDDGKQIPYSREKAEELLRVARDFRQLVASLAMERSRFQNEQAAATLGNSGES